MVFTANRGLGWQSAATTRLEYMATIEMSPMTSIPEASTMNHRVKSLATVAIVAVISAGLVFAPVAAAASGATHPTAPATNASPAAPQYETGTNPLVPTNTGALPYVIVPPGNGLAF
jgi:hypothetical protein